MQWSCVFGVRSCAWVLVGAAVAVSVAGCGSETRRSGKKRAPSPSAAKALAEGKKNIDSNRKKAIAAFTRAIKSDPQCREAYLWRGIAYKDSNNAKAALSDLTKAIKLDPTDSYAYEQRAEIYEKKYHNKAKAKADREKAFDLRQKNREEMRTRLKKQKAKRR